MSHILQNHFNEKVKITNIGEFDRELLQHELELSFSKHGARTPQGEWQSETLTVEDLINKCCNFEIGEKDGKAMLQGVAKNGHRSKDNMQHCDILMLDFDAGHEMQKVIDHIQSKGLAALIHTTYSHGTTKSELAKSAVSHVNDKNDDLQLSSIKSHLLDKKQWCPKLVESVTIETIEDNKIILRHDPIQKYRVIFFLKERFLFDEMSSVRMSLKSEWSASYKAFAETFSIPYDSSCTDPSRLMYTPRAPKGAEGHRVVIIAGKFLKLDDFKVKLNTKPLANETTIQKQPISTPGLKQLLVNNGDLFEVLDWIYVLDPNQIRNDKGDGSAEIECPFDHYHSNPGDDSDRACWVMNASASENGNYQFKCQHNSCSDRKPIEFVDELCNRYEQGCKSLKDYLTARIIGPNGETEDDVWKLIEQLTNQSSSEDVSYALHLISCFKNDLDEEKALKILKDRTGNNLSLLRGELRKEKRARSREAASNDMSRKLPIVSSDMDFLDQVNITLEAINCENTRDPKLFQREAGHLVRVYKHDDKIEAAILDTKGLTTEVSMLVLFENSSASNSVKRVAPFKDVISHIEGLAPPPFPYLSAIETCPLFASDGTLQTKNGYDQKTRRYISYDFDLKPISQTPTETEVMEAKGLLFDALEGFPFSDKFDGSEDLPVRIEGEANLERGISSRAGAIALILTQFMREMIDGPTPGFCIDKPKAGTGAGYLVDTSQVIVTGKRAMASQIGNNNDEVGKVITASLLTGASYLFFDNIDHHIDNPQLASAMTAGSYSGRILGTSEMACVQISQVWIFAANNGSYSNELMRRLIPIRIDAGIPDPTKQREFKHPDLHEWLFENRPNLVWACLTLIQNWIAKGCPSGEARLESFNAWASALAGVLEAAGIRGLLENHKTYMKSRNQDDNSAIAFVSKWFEKFGNDYVTSSELDRNLVDGKDLHLPINYSDYSQRSHQLSLYIGKNIEGLTFEIESDIEESKFISDLNFNVRCEQGPLKNKTKTWRLVEL